VRSTVIALTALPVFEAPSVATALTALTPSPAGGVHEVVHGPLPVTAEPIGLQVPAAQVGLALEHSKNWTETMSVSLELAVSEIEAGEAAFTYWPGAVNETDGAWLSTSTVTRADVVELPA
jgi:hypothetical protein